MHVGWLSGPSTTNKFFPRPLLPPSKFPGPFLWRVDWEKGAILPHPTSGGEVMDGKVVWEGEWAVVVWKHTWALVFLGTMNSSYSNNPSLGLMNVDGVQALWHGYLTSEGHTTAHNMFGMWGLHTCFPTSKALSLCNIPHWTHSEVMHSPAAPECVSWHQTMWILG
jgi:hypothetical protein